MQILVLGPIRARCNGDEVRLGPRLQRLLAALAVHRGTILSADKLADIVWEGEPPAGAEGTLRTYVTRLRQALGGADTIVFRQSGYELNIDDDRLDSHLFETELERARLAMQTADVEAASALLGSALERWVGDPFGEFGTEEWARPERVRLGERHTEALEAQVEVMIAHDHVDEAISRARSLCELSPLREHPRELLMRAMYVAGRQAEAVRVYRDYRELLGSETGLEPSQELNDLEGRIVRGDLPRSAPLGRARGYELGECLGRGAFSVVHRAVQPGIGRDVAVKVFRSDVADETEFVRRFEYEAQLIAAIEHPHVVPLYDFWREPGAAYLVMRWMRGGSLADLIRSRGPLSRQQVHRVLSDLGDALHAAHRCGVVHRDVRPANLLRDEEGSTYLADFGIAAPVANGVVEALVHYAAPEVLRGEPPTSGADVLSLGVTTFELLTGRLPFADTDDRAELVRRQLGEPLPSVRAVRTDLPAATDEVLAHATSKALGDRYSSVPEFVDDLLASLDGQRRRAGSGARSLEVTNPYVGLHAFTEADADRFFGRDRLVGELLDAVEQRKLVVLVGPSGSGKSSVVRAGLIPALRRDGVTGSSNWFITTMFPGPDPIDAMEAALLRIAVNPPASLREQLAERGGLLRAVRRVLPDDAATILLVVDQFEELFTVVASATVRDRFLAELAHAVEAPGSPLRVVATLRADHYDEPLRDPALAQPVTDGTVTVRPMRPDELEQAIVRPAETIGVDVELPLVAELVAGVADRPATLPLLQFSLTEVFERRVDDRMQLDTHRSLGGLTGALAARAERIVDRGDEQDERTVRGVFSRLVAFGESADGDARRRAPLAEFGDDERTAWLIDEFVSARLLVVGRDDDTRAPTLEVAHEALLRDWPRLRAWIDDDRDDLRLHRTIIGAVGEWEAAERDEGLLARGGRLELVSDLAVRRADLLNDDEHAWIDRSTEVARSTEAREIHRRNRLRTLLAGVAAMAVIAVAAAAVALVLRDRANANERAAVARELILEADRALSEDPELGILLALEAVEEYRAAGDEIPVSALSVVRSGIAANHVRGRVPGGLWVSGSDDGRMIATPDGDGGVALWDRTLSRKIETFAPDDWTVDVAEFRGGDLLVAAEHESGEDRVLIVDIETSEFEMVAPDVDLGSWADVALDRDRLVVMTADDLVIYQLTPTPTPLYEFAHQDVGRPFLHQDGTVALPDGTDDEPFVRLINVSTGEVRTIEDLAFLPEFARMSPSGEHVAISRSAGDIAIYEIDSGDAQWPVVSLSRGGWPVWSPDGARVVMGGEGDLSVIDADSGDVIDALDVHDGGTWSYSFLGASNEMVTASFEEHETLLIDLDAGTEGVGSHFEHPVGGAWKASTTATGELVVASGNAYAVLDLTDGDVLADGVGINRDGTGDHGWTNPQIGPNAEFVTVDDGISRLRRVADNETVWSAPPGWAIRGVDASGDRVVIHRSEEPRGRTKLITLETGADVALAGDHWFVAAADFTLDGGVIAITSTDVDHGVSLYDSDGRSFFDRSADSGLEVDFTADGSTMIVGTWYGDIVGSDVASLRDGASAEEAELFRIDAHDNLILRITVSPDERWIASTAQDEPARIWDLETGELVAELGSEAPGTAVDFDRTEPWVHVVEDSVVTTHTLDPEELFDAARSSVQRDLTDAECQRYLRRACDR